MFRNSVSSFLMRSRVSFFTPARRTQRKSSSRNPSELNRFRSFVWRRSRQSASLKGQEKRQRSTFHFVFQQCRTLIAAHCCVAGFHRDDLRITFAEGSNFQEHFLVFRIIFLLFYRLVATRQCRWSIGCVGHTGQPNF